MFTECACYMLPNLAIDNISGSPVRTTWLYSLSVYLVGALRELEIPSGRIVQILCCFPFFYFARL